MIALFLGIMLLCHSHVTLSQNSGGDYPDANEVMKNLPQTFMLQSLLDNRKLECRYQHFYNDIEEAKTYRKCDLKFFYGGFELDQTFYVRNVTGHKIFIAPSPDSPATQTLEILFSNMRSCMITRNPDPEYPKDCNLMVTKERFQKPLKRCRKKFQKFRNGLAFNYTISDCPYTETRI